MSNNKDQKTVHGFGARLEQRFTKSQIKHMVESSGLENVFFSNESIYRLPVGYREAE